jgi:hypothetical protein
MNLQYTSFLGYTYAMGIPKRFLILLAFCFALVLNVYLFLHEFLTRDTSSIRIIADKECKNNPNALTEQKTNPHKILFISCGGFLD